MKICKKCETITPDHFAKCPACGYKLSLTKPAEKKFKQIVEPSDELQDPNNGLAVNGDIDDLRI
ncbi:hypothetical protein CIG2463D_1011 [Campylobacter iguaniorum]|uniref:hypothetical protein n=1 Tax=Campylobacter iguaniorum TaxID=1244531 RepID=UPI00073A0C2B|nr:hypothetical protein [Campylobacter iguaniorum]ALV24584.1 hypothetical protein CIG2463D_1011 [Campylobacter iguaniorum]